MLVTALPLMIAAELAAPDQPVARPMFQPADAPDRPEIVFVPGDLWTAPLAGGEERAVKALLADLGAGRTTTSAEGGLR